MNFLIADTFQSSLARLTGAEQKAAKTAAFDLQLDPTGKGKSFHRLDRVRDVRPSHERGRRAKLLRQRLGGSEQGHVAPVPAPEHEADRGEGDQPPWGRGGEGVRGVGR